MTAATSESREPLFLKVIACEIFLREICHVAASARNLVDLEFLPQGLHDTPETGRSEIQQRIDAVPDGRYDAILVGYGLCGNIITGLRPAHTPLVIPRAHDCITLFLGSRARYEQLKETWPAAYFYTSGWIECLRRRGEKNPDAAAQFLPTRAGVTRENSVYQDWVAKYGEEKARYLMSVMDQWTTHYTHGVLIDFDFTRPLRLPAKVQRICQERGWAFVETPGDLRLIERWLNGPWDEEDFLIVPPRQQVVPSYKESVICAEPSPGSADCPTD